MNTAPLSLPASSCGATDYWKALVQVMACSEKTAITNEYEHLPDLKVIIQNRTDPHRRVVFVPRCVGDILTLRSNELPPLFGTSCLAELSAVVSMEEERWMDLRAVESDQ